MPYLNKLPLDTIQIMEGYIHRLPAGSSTWKKEYANVIDGDLRLYKAKGGKLEKIISLEDSKIEMVTKEPLNVTIQLPKNQTVCLQFDNMTDKVKWVNSLCMTKEVDEDLEIKNEILECVDIDGIHYKLMHNYRGL